MHSRESDSPSATRSRLAVLPNALTGIRLVLGLVYPFLPSAARGPVFVIAAATEFLDGYLARRMGIESLSGRILDPVADKVFVAAVLITLIRDGTITPLGAAAVASRDLLVWAGILVAWIARGRSALERMPPRLLGKLATAAQFFWILGVLVLGRSVTPLMVVAASLSFAAGIDYLATGARRILAGPRPS